MFMHFLDSTISYYCYHNFISQGKKWVQINSEIYEQLSFFINWLKIEHEDRKTSVLIYFLLFLPLFCGGIWLTNSFNSAVLPAPKTIIYIEDSNITGNLKHTTLITYRDYYNGYPVEADETYIYNASSNKIVYDITAYGSFGTSSIKYIAPHEAIKITILPAEYNSKPPYMIWVKKNTGGVHRAVVYRYSETN